MGVAVVWWSTHRIAAREVRGSNLGLGATFFHGNRGNRSRKVKMDGWMRARDLARARA